SRSRSRYRWRRSSTRRSVAASRSGSMGSDIVASRGRSEPTADRRPPPAGAAPVGASSSTRDGAGTDQPALLDHLAGVEQVVRVEGVLDGPVHPQADRTDLPRQPLSLEDPDSVLAGDRAAGGEAQPHDLV